MIAIEKTEVELLREQVTRLDALYGRALAELAACRRGTTVAAIAAEIEEAIGKKKVEAKVKALKDELF